MTTNTFNNSGGFFVCLLSNGSMATYTHNTQSAFTNVLTRPIQLNEQWVVGLTEISLNPFNLGKESHAARLTAAHSNSKTMMRKRCVCNDSNSGDVDYTPQKRNRKRNKKKIIYDDVEVFNPDLGLSIERRDTRLRTDIPRGLFNGKPALVIRNDLDKNDVRLVITMEDFFNRKFVYNKQKC